MKCLVIGCVWPEPNSSAAGENMLNLLTGARTRDWQVTFACAALPSTHGVDLLSLGIEQQEIKLNSSCFDKFVAELAPDMVIFDRFLTEEQFGWRVSKQLPHTLKVLNTEDLHGLRKQSQLQLQDSSAKGKANDVMLRELAAIMRCDLTLVISQHERDWLMAEAKMQDSQLAYFPLLPAQNHSDTLPTPFESRQHMSFIGNFKHPPNWHTVLHLHKLWPHIRRQLGHVECHIYGAYPPKKATSLTNLKTGFIVKGWIDNADRAFSSYRLALAPIAFGAGVKGKLIRAIANSTPSIVSELAIQGIATKEQWPGRVSADEQAFIEAVVSLYKDKTEWQIAQQKAHQLHQQLAQQSHWHTSFYQRCEQLINQQGLEAFRQQHLLSQVLNHHTLRSHQYMSQWIEVKNQLHTKP